MILYLNTNDKIAKIQLYDDGVIFVDEISFNSSFILSEELLQKIEALFNKNGHTKKELSLIAVNIGPGSYTGIRIGITTANCLAFSLGIPIIGVPDKDFVTEGLDQIIKKAEKDNFSSPVMPIYNFPPHITKEKSRL